MSSGKMLLKKMEGISTSSDEFYTVVATYFWQRTRPNLSYGFFFIFIAVMASGLAWIHEEGWTATSWIIGASCLAGVLGGIMIRSVMQVSKILTHGRQDRSSWRRLHYLRVVANVYREDAVSEYILTLPVSNEPPAGPEPLANYEQP